MPYQLVVLKGRSASSTLRIPPETVTVIGRQQGCQIRIVSSLVSRKHCELLERGGRLTLKDLGSSNGTYVNGLKVEEPTVLEPGSSLMIGSIVFRVEQFDAHKPATPGGPADTAITATTMAESDQADYEIEADSPSGVMEAASPTQPVSTRLEPAARSAALGEEEAHEIGEDAVAGFLLDLDVDDADQR